MSNAMVSVCVFSYNHEKYLRQCLDGIVMQQVSFPFEVRVHDDASTDSSQEIIKEYQARFPDIIKPILQSQNQYSKERRIFKNFILPWCEGEYIAFCEGDDYWTDPLKLQKQIDYMEAHPDCSMCFGNAIEHWSDNTFPDKLFSHIEDRDYTGVELSDQWLVPTASVVFRKSITQCELFDSFSSNRKLSYGDLPLWLTCATRGTIHGFSDTFSVYRRVNNGFMLSMNAQRRLSLGDTRVELFKLFGKEYRNTSIRVALDHYQSAFFDARKERKPELVVKSLWKSIYTRLAHPDIAFSRFKAFMHKRMQKLSNSTKKS